MNNSIYPCVWFESKATDAADFYVRSLPETLITSSNQVVTMLSIMNQPFMLINGGPNFVPNPSISFMLMHSDEQVIERMWERLLEGGKILMALDSYPWSPRYGWVEDKYGVSWQLSSSCFFASFRNKSRTHQSLVLISLQLYAYSIFVKWAVCRYTKGNEYGYCGNHSKLFLKSAIWNPALDIDVLCHSSLLQLTYSFLVLE